MMGRQDAQRSLYCVVNLDERVPEGHPLRKIKELVDFSFVRRAGKRVGPRRLSPHRKVGRNELRDCVTACLNHAFSAHDST
jgi:hypothetical protein